MLENILSIMNASVLIEKFQELDWTFRGIKAREGVHGLHSYPAMMAPPIARRLINELTTKGETVLDPFCGTGTTMIASLKYGRNSVGLDIEPEYCKMAARYLKAESNSFFVNTELQFKKMVYDNIGQVQVCEDQALYEVKSAKNTLEEANQKVEWT